MREKPKPQTRIWAMFCHLSALLAWMLLFLLVFLGIPLYLPFNILLPLIIWRFNKAKSPWVDFQGKESLNFQWLVLTSAMIILQLFLVNFAALKAYNGEHYRYPWTIRFLR